MSLTDALNNIKDYFEKWHKDKYNSLHSDTITTVNNTSNQISSINNQITNINNKLGTKNDNCTVSINNENSGPLLSYNTVWSNICQNAKDIYTNTKNIENNVKDIENNAYYNTVQNKRLNNLNKQIYSVYDIYQAKYKGQMQLYRRGNLCQVVFRIRIRDYGNVIGNDTENYTHHYGDTTIQEPKDKHDGSTQQGRDVFVIGKKNEPVSYYPAKQNGEAGTEQIHNRFEFDNTKNGAINLSDKSKIYLFAPRYDVFLNFSYDECKWAIFQNEALTIDEGTPNEKTLYYPKVTVRTWGKIYTEDTIGGDGHKYSKDTSLVRVLYAIGTYMPLYSIDDLTNKNGSRYPGPLTDVTGQERLFEEW